MAEYSTPTKSNLINAENSLKMATQGYEMLDLKRKLLIRELAKLEVEENKLRKELSENMIAAKKALCEANVRMGIERVENVATAIPEISDINIKFYSVMGVEIPIVYRKEKTVRKPYVSLYKTSLALDEARFYFGKVCDICLEYAENISASERLNINIRKTQIRANALKNIMIPRYTRIISEISEAIEEKERSEFSRLKAVKKMYSEKSV